jgi:hypothetical protein
MSAIAAARARGKRLVGTLPVLWSACVSPHGASGPICGQHPAERWYGVVPYASWPVRPSASADDYGFFRTCLCAGLIGGGGRGE